MSSRHHRNDGLGGNRSDSNALGLVIRTDSYQRQVQSAATQGVDELTGICGAQGDFDGGVATVKLRNKRRDVDTVGRDSADVDRSAYQLRGLLDGTPDVQCCRQSGFGVWQCGGTCRGEPYRALGPIQQGLAQFAFQPLDLGAHYRLRHMKLLRRAGEVRFLADLNEVLQLPKFHTRII